MITVRIKQHPVMGILVGSDGHVMVPETKYSRAHWTLGSMHSTGYRSVKINSKEYQVHRLVAETFLENPFRLSEIDHINRVRDDNRPENLRFCTKSDNQRNTCSHDRCSDRIGVHTYEDRREYNRRNCRDWYEKNKDAYNAKRRMKRKEGIKC